MITIRCCETCKHYDADEEHCNYSEPIGMTRDDWCPAWEDVDEPDD